MRLLALIPLLLLGVVPQGPVSTLPGQSASLEQQVKRVEASFRAGQPEAALPVLRELVRGGQYQLAEQLLRRGRDASASSPEFEYLIGFCLTQRYEYEQAEVLLRSALRAAPRQDGWRHTLAKCLAAQGRNREAIIALDEALALNPRPEYRFAKAMCALNLAEYDVARSELTRSLESHPADAEALHVLGTLAADRGEDERSLELFRQALAVNPRHLEARFRLGLAESKVGDPERAVAAFEAVLEEVPGHVGALYNSGRTLIRLGRAEEGRLRLEAFRAMSTLEDEIHFVQDFVKNDPTNVEKRCTLAWLHLRAGRTREALSELETARNLAPATPAVYRLMAECFGRLGRDADAAQAGAFAASLEERRR